MKAVITVISTLFVFSTLSAQLPSEKRGLAYGYHSNADLEVLSEGVSWWYNWAVTPESTVLDSYTGYGFEFVPMAWNGSFNETALRSFLDTHPDVKYILGFNEPNFIDQANMTPTEAAAQWIKIESIADDYGLTIVGPAVNFCGNCVSEGGTTYTDPFDYLDDFFDACAGCRVDHIAVHSYMNTVAALEWYIGEFKKYGKPIWLTEFAGWESNGNINTIDDQISYMIGAVDFLEYDTAVFRYAWFIGRGDGITAYPFIDILGNDGVLTPLGEVYVNMPVHDPDLFHPLPGRIEAEEYTDMSGILLEKTSDVIGFANVGYFDASDWLSYNVTIENDGTYYLSLRVASTSAARLSIRLDGTEILNRTLPVTGGWQNWQTIFDQVSLPAGEHTITLTALTPGFNINWIEVSEEKPNALLTGKDPELISLFPNPAQNFLQIETMFPILRATILDESGRVVMETRGSNRIDISGLSKGMYTLHLTSSGNKKIAVRRFIKLTD